MGYSFSFSWRLTRCLNLAPYHLSQACTSMETPHTHTCVCVHGTTQADIFSCLPCSLNLPLQWSHTLERVNIRKSRKMASTQERGKPRVGCPTPSKQLKTLLIWDPNGCFFVIPWRFPPRASDNNTFYLYGRALTPYCLCIFELPIYFSSLALRQFTDPVSWRWPGDRQ